jgi:hypothetical protein
MSSKPLPLKQRTASVDGRRDFSTKTWTSLLELLKLREYIVTVDHFVSYSAFLSGCLLIPSNDALTSSSIVHLASPSSMGNGEWQGSSGVYDSAIRLQYGIHVSLTEY